MTQENSPISCEISSNNPDCVHLDAISQMDMESAISGDSSRGSKEPKSATKKKTKKRSKKEKLYAQITESSFEENRWEWYKAEIEIREEAELTWNLGKTIGLVADESDSKVQSKLEEIAREDNKCKKNIAKSGKRRNKKVN